MGHYSMYDVEKDSYPGFSEQLDIRAKQALMSTWDRIACGMLVNEDGRPDERKSLTKEEELEVVLDADRMADHDPEAARYTIWLSRYHKERYDGVVHSAFPYETLGY
jgi:hypothetical protein